MIQEERILIMKFKRSIVVFIAIISLLALTACSGSNEEQNTDNNNTNMETEPNKTETESERSEEHTSELQSRGHLVCRLLLEKKKNKKTEQMRTREKTISD